MFYPKIMGKDKTSWIFQRIFIASFWFSVFTCVVNLFVFFFVIGVIKETYFKEIKLKTLVINL